MGLREESIRRNPAADLGGGTFFRVSNSVASVAEMLFGLTGGGAALTADSCQAFRGEYALKFACCATVRDERFMGIVVLLVALFSALTL